MTRYYNKFIARENLFNTEKYPEDIPDDSPPYNKLLKAMVLSIKKGDTVSL